MCLKGGKGMNKKLLFISILAVLLLITITYASAITTNTTSIKKRESPLYLIRNRLAIGERIQILKAKFVGERLFFLPFQSLRDRTSISALGQLGEKTSDLTCQGPPPSHVGRVVLHT
jgi:hypothetical protein